MNAPDLDKIPGIALHENRPVFSEPWEAQAFALVVGLHEKGAFSWPEWADVLGQTISADKENTSYYHLWLRALETIVSQKSLITDEEVNTRKSEWQAALLATPHGQPIELHNVRST
ncbi:MAG: nitrile hydratase accessory protein [Pseudomonadota bacterium]